MGLIKTKELFKLFDCWLSPTGEVVIGDETETLYAFHENLAECVIREMKNFETTSEARMWFLETEGSYKDAYDWLEEQGWIRLHGYRSFEKAQWITYVGQKMSFQQKQVIRNWCKINGKTWQETVQVC